MSTGKALNRQAARSRDQNSRFVFRQIGAEKLVERLKHECGAQFDDGAEYVDATRLVARDLLANSKVAMECVGGFRAPQNGVSGLTHLDQPCYERVILGSLRSAPAPLGLSALAP